MTPEIAHPVRRKNLSQTMKMNLSFSRWNRAGHRSGFTLVELLVVIAIIGVLAAMLFPVIIGVQKKAKIAKAKLEEKDIANAITAYQADYGRFPLTTVEKANSSALGLDLTLGLTIAPASGPALPAFYTEGNFNLISILMDLETLPDGTVSTNKGHVFNPKMTKYLAGKFSGYNPSSTEQPLGGIDLQGNYRDPWGNPYIITMNTSYSMESAQGAQGTLDAFYSLNTVSANTGTSGKFGLVNSTDPGAGNHYRYHGSVMVWSLGPDGKYQTDAKADAGFNKDNVLSWQ